MRNIVRVPLLAAIALAGAVPAEAQTIIDTFNRLRSTVGQLGARKQPRDLTPTSAGASAAAAATPAGAPNAIVPPGLLVADQSDTSLAATPLVPRRIITFDLRGLKLGMSPREVGRVASSAGFARRWNDTIQTSGTFEDAAIGLANERLNRPIPTSGARLLRATQAVDASGNMLECEFTLEPVGPRLSRVVYTTKLDGATKDATVQALRRKYGPPNGGDPSINSYAWIGEHRPFDSATPTLTVIVDADSMMATLLQSGDYFQGVKRRLGERAQAIAASRGGGVRL